MSEVKSNIGYESLKSQYMRKYPMLGQNTPNNLESVDDESEELNSDPQNDNEVVELKEKLSVMEKEHDENRKNLEQRLHQAKRNSDLAKNKICTATECLDMFLIDYLKSKDIDEFDQSFKFLVTQYSSLLYTPECYTVNAQTSQVTLSDDLFSDLADKNSDISDKISTFKSHLKDKLSLDYSVRRERRLSSTSSRSRLPSFSSKRLNNDVSIGNPTKRLQHENDSRQ